MISLHVLQAVATALRGRDVRLSVQGTKYPDFSIMKLEDDLGWVVRVSFNESILSWWTDAMFIERLLTPAIKNMTEAAEA